MWHIIPMASAFKKKPKVFIMGLSGFLGYHLACKLRDKFTVVGCYFQHPVKIRDVHAFPMSLKDNTDMLERLVAIQAPDFAISAAGISDPKVITENSKLAENINVSLPLAFALMATRNRAKHILLSCADVFDGTTGDYDENSRDFAVTGGLGKMKATASAYVRAQTMEGTILRIGRVLGLGHPFRHSFVDELRARLQSGKTYHADETKIHSYLTTASMTAAIEELLLNPFPPNKQRLFHIGGPTANELEICQILSVAMGLDTRFLKLIPQGESINLSLNSTLMESTFKWKAESKEQLLNNFLTELKPGLTSPSKHLKVGAKKEDAAKGPVRRTPRV